MAATSAMFRHIWQAKQEQAQEVLRATKRKTASLEKEIDRLLDTISAVSKRSVISRCEEKIDMLEREKTKLTQEMANITKPKGRFEEKLEPVLTFLANPFRIWDLGDITLRRLVLKLAFSDRIQYDRFEGVRTLELAFPFKVLRGIDMLKCQNGADEKTRTSTGVTPQRPQRCASTIPPHPHAWERLRL